jgi:hypothetical protein
MGRLRAIPRYTAAVVVLVLAATVYALAQGNPLGVVMAVVLIIFVGGPVLVLWAHQRRGATHAAAMQDAAVREFLQRTAADRER